MSSSSTLAILGSVVALSATWTLDSPVMAAEPVDEAVEQLVLEAEAANLELAGAGQGVAQRLAILDQARARFLPALDLGMRYSMADGRPSPASTSSRTK